MIWWKKLIDLAIDLERRQGQPEPVQTNQTRTPDFKSWFFYFFGAQLWQTEKIGKKMISMFPFFLSLERKSNNLERKAIDLERKSIVWKGNQLIWKGIQLKQYKKQSIYLRQRKSCFFFSRKINKNPRVFEKSRKAFLSSFWIWFFCSSWPFQNQTAPSHFKKKPRFTRVGHFVRVDLWDFSRKM